MSRWPAEDGGPRRLQAPHGGPSLAIGPGDRLAVAATRDVIAATMVVLGDRGPYLLRHSGGDGAVSWVERFDPETLEVLDRSPDLPGGPTWPGGLAVHPSGDLHVVFGRHAHRLAPNCSLLASRALPRNRPYNSFVTLPDGHLVTKDFGAELPAGVTQADPIRAAELVVLEPVGLEVVARLELPEPSMARLSAAGDDVYVVGDEHLLRVRWTGGELVLDEGFVARYRTLDGQTAGWDVVVTDDTAWFLDDGAGTERYAGSLRGCGASAVPLHLVRVDLATGEVRMVEVSGMPGGVVANPPAVDVRRGVVVAYDSGNGIVAGFGADELDRRWQVELDHGGHPILYPDTGEVVLGDHGADGEHVVVLDVATGQERARVATGSPVQSVVFAAPGLGRDLYAVTFTTLTRVLVEP